MKPPLFIFLDDMRDENNIKMEHYRWCDEVWDKERGFWRIVRSVEEAKKILMEEEVSWISLDHDMGVLASSGKLAPEGIDLCRWMSQNNKWPERVTFHTGNPVGRKNMIEEYESWLNKQSDP